MHNVTQSSKNDDQNRSRFELLERMNSFHIDNGCEADASEDSFMQLYASLMILLLTFFIIIFSQMTYSQAKFQLARESLHQVFKQIGILHSRDILGDVQIKSSDQVQKSHKNLYLSLSEISSELEKEFDDWDVEIKSYETIFTIPHESVFHSGEYSIKKEAHDALNRLVKYVKKDSYDRIIINNYYMSTEDHEETAETSQNDWLVSAFRSLAIRVYLMANGLKSEEIVAVGFGNNRPLPLTYDIENEEVVNSRIEVIIEKHYVVSNEDNVDLLVEA